VALLLVLVGRVAACRQAHERRIGATGIGQSQRGEKETLILRPRFRKAVSFCRACYHPDVGMQERIHGSLFGSKNLGTTWAPAFIVCASNTKTLPTRGPDHGVTYVLRPRTAPRRRRPRSSTARRIRSELHGRSPFVIGASSPDDFLGKFRARPQNGRPTCSYIRVPM
jgi:hypothetical protein